MKEEMCLYMFLLFCYDIYVMKGVVGEVQKSEAVLGCNQSINYLNKKRNKSMRMKIKYKKVKLL